MRRHEWKMSTAAILSVGGMFGFGGCIPDNFFITQFESVLATIVDAMVTGTVLPALGV